MLTLLFALNTLTVVMSLKASLAERGRQGASATHRRQIPVASLPGVERALVLLVDQLRRRKHLRVDLQHDMHGVTQ